MIYSDFAKVYDQLMQDAQYPKRAEYLFGLFRKFGSVPKLLLDAGCGTGELSLLMARKGMDVIGVDASAEMLSEAQKKAVAEKCDVLFLCQPLEELDLYGTVDGCVCTLDVLNHFTDKRVLQKALQRISLFMEKKSVFIFDVNTPYKHACVLGDNTFVYDTPELFYVWQNQYNPKTCRVDIDLDFFVQRENEGYQRFSESFCERAYSFEELKPILNKVGFEILAVYRDLTLKKPAEQDERLVYVCRKQ